MRQLFRGVIMIFLTCSTAIAQANVTPPIEETCPDIKISTPQNALLPRQSAFFEVFFGNGIGPKQYKYFWTASLGKIAGGQGTAKIELIPARQDNGSNLTVSVQIGGLPRNCESTFSSDIIPIVQLPIGDPVDRYGKSSKYDERSRIDSFFIQLNNNPTSAGLFVIGFNSADSGKYKRSRLSNILTSINFRKYDIKRVSFAIYEGDFEDDTSLWLVPPRAELPEIADEYILIKGKDLARKIPTLFKKNNNSWQPQQN